MPSAVRPEVLPFVDGLAAAVDLAVTRPAHLGGTRLVAVDGPSGSGKTSLSGPLAEAIAARMGGEVIVPERVAGDAGVGGAAAGCEPATGGGQESAGRVTGARPSFGSVPRDNTRTVAVVSTDLLATWEQPLDWWPILDEHLLCPIAAGHWAAMPVVEWVAGNPRPGGCISVPPVDVLVLEGVSSGRGAVADRLSVLVWVEVPGADVRLARAVARDGEGMRPFLTRWQDDEQTHFAADRTRSRADVVIDPLLPGPQDE